MSNSDNFNPPYLPVGTEVSAKYKGAFCEAKIRKIVRVVKCKVTFKAGLGTATLLDDQIKGTLRIGNTVEARHHDKNQFVEGTINKIQDCSQYTVVFDDGDITTLRRSALVLKSGRHFNESETLDQLPLTHPEHFSNPVVGGRRGVRRRAANTEDNDRDDSSEDEDLPVKKGRKKPPKEADMGKVVCVDSTDKKKSKDNWFPALVVSPSAQETVKIRTKDEYLVRSFRDGRYYTVPKKETTGFTKDSSNKSDLISNVLRTACEKAVQYLEKNELPPHWDRDVLFGHLNAGNSDDGVSESESSEDDQREEKDRFVAQLYKFMDERGTPINKVPTVCSKDLDLYKLYKIVTSRGGYNKVSNTSQWKPVTVKMGYGTMPTTSTINLVKQGYKRFLQNFEELYRKLGNSSFVTSVDSRPTAAGKSRSHRSIFRERHASTKETKKVEEPKVEKEEEEKPTCPVVDNVETDSVLSDTGSKKSEQSEESSRRSRSRLDSSKSKKDQEEPIEKPEKPTPVTKSKRVYKKKTDTTTTAAATTSTPTPSVPPVEPVEIEKPNNDTSPVVATPTIPTPTTTEPPPLSLSPGPGGKRRGKYSKKKEVPVEEEETKAKTEEAHIPTSAHIGKNVKIQVGDKLQVYYGPQSDGNVTYEAKVVDIDEPNQKYLVHYTGWNTRYDEWIKRFRISSLSVGKSNEGGNSDLETVQQNNNKPPSTPKSSKETTTTTTTTRRKGRPLSGSQNTSSSSSGTSSNKVGGRRRQPSESEKGRVKRKPRRKSGQDSSFNQSGSEGGMDSSEDESEKPENRVSKGNSRSGNKKMVEDDEASSASSSNASSGHGVSKSTNKPQGMTVSSTTSLTTPAAGTNNTNHPQNQVLDINQIRSELKGLDKMVKLTQQQQAASCSSSTSAGNSATTTAAIPTIVVPTSSEDKLDIYEFQDDANDTPKLKMFSPRSPEKKDEASVNKSSSSGENLSKTTQQEDSINASSKETSVLNTSPSLTAVAATPLLPSTTTSSAARNFSPTIQIISKGESTLSSTTAKTKSYSPFAHGTKTTNVPSTTSLTPPHSFHGAVSIPNPGAVKMLQVTTAMENKSLRMLTPILHTPQQPLRHRAVLSHSFPPPPLIPSSLNSVPLRPAPVPIQPRATSPPMPSLIQRPSVSSALATGLPLSTNSQVQHMRPIAPTNLLTATPGVMSSMQIQHAPNFQSGTPPAVIIKNVEPKSPPFVSRQQELFPHLVQQSKHSGKSAAIPVPKLTTTSSSASVNISLSPIPISSISPSQTMFHSTSTPTSTLTVNKGETINTVGSSLPKKPNLKRKKPIKDKSTVDSNATSVILPEVVTGNVTNISKPKKKPKKVITKNIIDLQKEESTLLKDKRVEEPVTMMKKPRKPSKKKIKLEKMDTPPPSIAPKIKSEKPPPPLKGKEKQPRRKNSGKNTPVQSLSGPSTTTSSIIMVGSSCTTTQDQGVIMKPSELLSVHSSMEQKQFKGATTLGVLKTAEKKSYAPKMSAATAARVVSCIDNVAKLPVDSTVKMEQSPTSEKLPVIINTTISPVTMPLSKTLLHVSPASVVGKIQSAFQGIPATITTATTTITATTSLTISKVSGDSRFLTTNTSTDIQVGPGTKPLVFPTTLVTSGNEFIGSSSTSQKNSKPIAVLSMSQEMTKLSNQIKEDKNLVSSFSSVSSSDDASSLLIGNVSRDKELVQKSRLVPNSSIKSEDKLKSKECTPTVDDSKELMTTKEEDESCHSLLCEEIIPRSPVCDDDSPFDDDENAIHPPERTGIKKDSKMTSFNSSIHSPQRNQAYGGSSSGSTTNKQEPVTTFLGIPSSRTTDSTTVKKEEKDSKDFDTKTDEEMILGVSKASRNLGGTTESNLSILQKHREVGKAAQSLLSLSGIERPTTSGNGGGYSHPTIQHVMDNTPPTTPESSSISSGSPRVDGGRVSPTNDHPSSSKSKDSSDADSTDQKLHEATEEGFSSDAGRKSSKGRSISSPQKKKHAESGRNARTSSPPLKRRRIQRKKSPDEVIRAYSYRGRGSGGRKGNASNDNEHHGRILPPPPLNLTKPPPSNKYNFIPDLDDDLESEQRIQVLQQALQDIKEKYIEIKTELASFERRRKRFNRREKERDKARLSQKST